MATGTSRHTVTMPEITPAPMTTAKSAIIMRALRLKSAPAIIVKNILYLAIRYLPCKTSAGWNGTVTPFEVMKDRLYSLGDGYTCIFLFVSDPDENGHRTMTELDAGNAHACYSYWLNMWKMGFDPRELDNLLLTHGHGDHYQGMYELVTFVNRANGYDRVNVRTSGANEAGFVNGVYAGITLTDKPERYCVDQFNDWETWIPFGEGVEVYPVTTAGHTNDTASFIFKLTSVADDPYFSKKSETPVTTAWVYMGGYGGGAATRTSNGYTRLQYKNSMQYLQSVTVPYAQSVSDYVYSIPQHGDQAPWSEISKAVRIKQAQGEDILFLDAYNEGTEGIINLYEKRMSAYSYNWMNKAWKMTESTNADVCYDHGNSQRPDCFSRQQQTIAITLTLFHRKCPPYNCEHTTPAAVPRQNPSTGSPWVYTS